MEIALIPRKLSSLISSSLIALLGAGLCAGSALAADRPSFTVGWSVYVGWNPWYYMGKSGIL
ncbi:MAG TPA: hypothetical protein VG345_14615, partial [Bryobacteraceae bacterium]|nr:hypothetical protein [Bryobacteraceae bacterium]